VISCQSCGEVKIVQIIHCFRNDYKVVKVLGVILDSHCVMVITLSVGISLCPSLSLFQAYSASQLCIIFTNNPREEGDEKDLLEQYS